MTSRSEYRLLLRQDNADLRLTQKGYDIGLVNQERYEQYLKRKDMIKEEIQRIKKVVIAPTEEVNEFLEKNKSSQIKSGVLLYDIMKRPEMNYELLGEIDTTRPELPRDVQEEAEIQIKYEGYIEKQMQQVEQYKKVESRKIPENINYDDVSSLRIEARQKLSKIRPDNIGQASRISGVSPADVSVLLIYLEQYRRKRESSVK
jgi:tRNA uridine 5-carboxymethylaminomethyl modification enzyme